MEWRSVQGFEDSYEVSSAGDVRRILKEHGTRVGRYLQPTTNSWGGYPRVGLTRLGKSYRRFVHRIVAAAFLGACPDGYEVNHKDSNRLNPSANNLEYVTRRENIEHAQLAGRRNDQRGEQRNNHKLTVQQVRTIRESDGTHRALGIQYGVHHSVIGRIKRGEKWKVTP